MVLKYIGQEDIQQILGIQENFQTVEELCDYLQQKGSGVENTDIRMAIRPLVKKADPQAKPNKCTFEDNVRWIRENCTFEQAEESSLQKEGQEQSVPDSPVKPSEDTCQQQTKEYFEQAVYEFETKLCQQVQQLEGEELDYPQDLSLCEGGIITRQKEFTITVSKDGLVLDTKRAMLVEAEGCRVLALGCLVNKDGDPNTYDVVFDNRDYILYDRFEGQSQYRLIVYSTAGQPYGRLLDMDYKPFYTEKERPLCIDFGTSNTTAGSYGIRDYQADQPEIVRFIDRTVKPANTEAMLMPTIVYVEDCADPNDIHYLFGYEARRRIEEEHYESKASVFYEIKRWITSAEEKEEIRDSKNHKAYPYRREIIKAYIDYVIDCAEQYFETRFQKIHFSAPVKLKEQFLRLFSQLYEGRKEVLSGEESIDEGIAIVYNQIITLLYYDLENETAAENREQEKSILIMDCGGGTTDLASCEYSYRRKDGGIELTLKTGFENGNSNFGGNNITYRILQLLKIKIAAKYFPALISHEGKMLELIQKSENEILGIIESQSGQNVYNSDDANDEVYQEFLENYEKAEDVIPTRFTGNHIYRGTEEIKKIKRNFYYLWRKAEQIKIDFFKTERVVIEFQENKEDMELVLTDTENYYLYCAQEKGGKLKRLEQPFSDISITIKEINRVICGDVYALLCGLFQDGAKTCAGKSVEQFDFYKLSGQSCKITLFSELLKEYIPGRKLRPAIMHQKEAEKKKSEDLKLECVLGSINYVKDQIRPEMKVFIHPRIPKIIYDVWLKGIHAADRRLFDCGHLNEIQLDVCHENTKEYPLRIVGENGLLEREFIFRLLKPSGGEEEWMTDEIKLKLLKESFVTEEAVQGFIEKLRTAAEGRTEKINVIFAVPAKGGYGIYLGQILAAGGADRSIYKWIQFEYQNFEDASKTFFDGRR